MGGCLKVFNGIGMGTTTTILGCICVTLPLTAYQSPAKQGSHISDAKE